MEDRNWFFGNFPVWMRWILFPILLIFSYVLSLLLSGVLFSVFLAGFVEMNSIHGIVVQIVFSVGISLYLSYHVIPKRKMLVSGITSMVFGVMYLVDVLLIAIVGSNDDISLVAKLICSVIFFVIAVYLLRSSKADENLYSTDDSFNNSSFESGGNLMIKCPVCQTKNTEETLFCKTCGVKMSSAIEAARRIKTKDSRAFMLCMSCGAENVNNSTYCIKCGSLLAMPEPQVNSPRNEVRAAMIECPYCRQLSPANSIFCGNCGKNVKIGAANQITQVSADAQKLTGIGGWLILPVIGIFLTILMGFIAIMLDRSILSNLSSSDRLIRVLYFELFMEFTFAILPIFALVLLFKKKKAFPKFMVCLFIVICIFHITDIAWGFSVLPEGGAGASAYVFFRIIATAIWIPYFLKSKRVKNTFVN